MEENKTFNQYIKSYIPTDKHPTEIIQELDYEIGKTYKEIQYIKVQLEIKEQKLEKLQQRKQSLLNYLNHDDE